MAIGLVGKKLGMTRVFQNGASVPVTVVEVLEQHVTQVKTLENDGYSAIQVTTGLKKASRVNRAEKGHFAKAKVEAGRGLWEFRTNPEEAFEVGASIHLEAFSEGQIVDVQAISKGKGFAGTVKRHNFRTQDATHGNSRSHRVPGSIGQRQTPGRVFKNKKMAGHMGAEQVTIQNLNIVRIDKEKNVILIRGAIPGAPGGDVVILPAVKAKYVAEAATA
jgi:large subunit ribosomal protein L3